MNDKLTMRGAGRSEGYGEKIILRMVQTSNSLVRDDKGKRNVFEI
jgi:hypothetical protein